MKKRSLVVSAVIFVLMLLSSSQSMAADNRNDLNTHLAQLGAYIAEAFGFGGPCGESDAATSPVLASNREFIWDVTDVALNGRPSLHLTRYYRSYDTREGIFGKGWSTHCEKALIRVIDFKTQEDSSNAVPVVKYIYRAANGKRYEFVQSASDTFTSPAGLTNRSLALGANGSPSIRYLDGSSETYNSQGQLTVETDRNGNAVNYDYIGGALSRMSDENGRFLALSYNSSGHVSSVTDHGDRIWRYAYNPDGSLESVTDPAGGVKRYEYQSIQREASAEVYPAISKIIDEAGITTITVGYDDVGKVSTYAVGENVFAYSVDNRGFVYKTDSAGSRWAHKTGEYGLINEFYPPINNRIPEAKVFDENGNITNYTDLAGTEFSYTYDALGRITSTTTPDGTSSLSYQGNTSWIAEATSISGRSISFTYDSRGNPLSVTDPVGNSTNYVWNDNGDLTGATDPLGNSVSQAVNDIGLVTRATDPLGRSTSYSYDTLGRLSTITDAAGSVSSLTYDALDRLTSTTDGLGHVTRYRYDAAGRLTGVTDAAGGTYVYTYDVYGRLITEVRPDGSEYTHSYNTDNLLAGTTDPRGVTTSFTYDAGKRLTRMNAGRDSYSYRYDVLGRTTQASSGASTVSYTYDSLHRVLTETQDRRTTSYGYNNESELVALGYIGEDLSYNYDERGFLTGFTTPTGTHQYTYDAAGRMVSHIRPNGSAATFSYDGANQLLEQDFSLVSGERFNYSYDNVGRVEQITGKGAADWSYQYDAIHRLTSGSHTQGYAYQYDALGNRLENGGTFDAFNKLIEDNEYSYFYDEVGSLISKSSKATDEEIRYSYDGFLRLASVSEAPVAGATASTTTQYSYDAFGRRTSKVVDRRESTQYRWKGDDLIAEYQSGTTPVVSYRYDGGYSAVEYTDAGGTYDVLTDHLGSAIRLIDQSGSVAWSEVNGPYGEADVGQGANAVQFNQRFPGQYFDKESGLHYNRNRYYDPALGRYLRSDPIGIAGGLNEYLYGHASPINRIDPTGNVAPFVVYGLYALGAGLFAVDSYNTINNACLSGGQKALRITGDVLLGMAGGKLVSGIFKRVPIAAFSKVAPATTKQLQKKFKHAGDFGISGNYSPSNAKRFNQAIQKHLNAPGTKEISGTYRGNSVTFHTNPTSGLTVIQNPNGSFLSGWKLNPTQLQHVIKNGKL